MADQVSTQNFYGDLPAFFEFREIADLEHYRALPDDWTLLISDVVGSTKAIERGKYKTVNMVGAASIINIINVNREVQLPFVFGGDGGLIAVPPQLLDDACRAMKQLQAASSQLFGLSLRAGAIPVSALRLSGADTLVRKYRLSQGNDLAMFAGSGPTIADQWLKSDDSGKSYTLVPDENEDLPDLEGLSCRWEPLKSRNGVMLTIILLPTASEASETSETSEARKARSEITSVNDALNDILGHQVAGFAPAHDDALKFRFPPKGLGLEIAAGASQSTRLRRTTWAFFTALMQYFCERFAIKIGDYDGASYRDELKGNTDFRKFDGALRMVVDVNIEQAAQIEAFLESKYRAGRFFYGTWQTDHAIMTCLLFNLSEHQHIHFIDGANGGYAMAAKSLKQQMKEAEVS